MIKRIIFIGIISLLVILIVTCADEKITLKKQNRLKKTATKINAEFVKIRKEVNRLADKIQRLYSPDIASKTLAQINRSKYEVHSTGVMYKPKNDGKSSVWVAGNKTITPSIKEIVFITEPMEHELQRITEKFPEIVQAYYNERHDYNRMYPFIDVLAHLPVSLNVKQFNFYFLADSAHNPEKKPVWVDEPYVDPAGRGWMVSAIAPVYVNNQLEGVAGLDVTINTITKRYIDEAKENLMILDKNGVVVTTNDFLTGLFTLPTLKNHKYLETIKLDTYKTDNYNLLKSKNPDVRQLAQKIYTEDIKKLYFQNKKYLILIESIPEMNWKLLNVIGNF